MWTTVTSGHVGLGCLGAGAVRRLRVGRASAVGLTGRVGAESTTTDALYGRDHSKKVHVTEKQVRTTACRVQRALGRMHASSTRPPRKSNTTRTCTSHSPPCTPKSRIASTTLTLFMRLRISHHPTHHQHTMPSTQLVPNPAQPGRTRHHTNTAPLHHRIHASYKRYHRLLSQRPAPAACTTHSSPIPAFALWAETPASLPRDSKMTETDKQNSPLSMQNSTTLRDTTQPRLSASRRLRESRLDVRFHL